jgi:spore germination protein YaaH
MTTRSARRRIRRATLIASLLAPLSLVGTGAVAEAAPHGASTPHVAAVSATTSPSPAYQFQEWMYPGPAGNVTCSAPSEYHDGRVKAGVLKAEYWDIDTNGNDYERLAGDPANACNGYSPANAADVKAWSSQQYVTLSLADLPSEEALTGNAAKSAAAISTVTNFAKQIGFTGVDVDFENYWSWVGNDQENYYTFLTNLASALHAQGLKFQVEGPPDTTTGFNYGTVLADGVDQVVMMAYDDEYQSPVGSTCLAFSPYAWMKDLLTSALAQIPTAQHNRFVAGLPAEAYTATSQCQNITGNQTFLDMTKAPGYSSDPAVTASRRDPASGEIRWSSGGSFYDYVDQTALDSKLALAESLGVTNFSVWTLGGGNAWFSKSIGTSST